MALVVLIKGVNVGGHRRFRPAALASDLRRLDVVNIGAAGTLVVRRPIRPSSLREEILRRIPFDAEVMICSGADVLNLAAANLFPDQTADANVVHFVSLLGRRPRSSPALPLELPAPDDWCVRILGQLDRFVYGVYRREMRTIRYLDQLDAIFGVPATTRSWSTISSIVGALDPSRKRGK